MLARMCSNGGSVMTAKYVLPLVGVLGLAACGGGGGGGGGAPTFAQLDFEAGNLLNSLAGSAVSSSIPSANTGEYEGVIVMTDDLGNTTDGFIGDVFLRANFAGGGSMTGTAGGFYAIQVDGGGNPSGPASPVGGSLDFSSGALSAGLNAVTLNVTGNLTVGGGSQTITGAMTGSFGETSGDAADGNADIFSASASGTDITVGGGSIADLDATLIAED